MSRWTAPSDLDYYDSNHHHSGIERTCQECGEPVMVSRTEEYQVHVFHEKCLDAIRQRLEAARTPDEAA
jgi:hypothetical protein